MPDDIFPRRCKEVWAAALARARQTYDLLRCEYVWFGKVSQAEWELSGACGATAVAFWHIARARLKSSSYAALVTGIADALGARERERLEQCLLFVHHQGDAPARYPEGQSTAAVTDAVGMWVLSNVLGREPRDLEPHHVDAIGLVGELLGDGTEGWWLGGAAQKQSIEKLDDKATAAQEAPRTELLSPLSANELDQRRTEALADLRLLRAEIRRLRWRRRWSLARLIAPQLLLVVVVLVGGTALARTAFGDPRGSVLADVAYWILPFVGFVYLIWLLSTHERLKARERGLKDDDLTRFEHELKRVQRYLEDVNYYHRKASRP